MINTVKIISTLKISLLLILLSTSVLPAQNFEQTPEKSHLNSAQENGFWDRVYTGGGIGLQFGSQTLINVSPILGYRLTDRFSMGVGITYMYYRYKDQYPDYSYSSNTYGGSVFSRYLILENLFAHVEYELLRLEVRDNVSRLLGKKDITSVLVGGGYRQMLGDRSSINLMVLYNLNETAYSPYQNPVIRLSFGFGI
jgi:outer membrane protein assembly factor BamA